MSYSQSRKLAALAALVLLAGCSVAGSGQGAASYVHVSEITLSDGTRCVVADYHGTGIACDWSRP